MGRLTASERTVVKVLDRNYQQILATSGKDGASMAWLTSRLLLFSYSIGIAIATFDRLSEITHAATRTVSILREDFAIKDAAINCMYQIHGTTCFTEVLNMLSRYPESTPLQMAGLRFLVILLRPMHGENLSTSRLGLRSLINDSQAAKEVLMIATHHKEKSSVIALLLKVCTNLEQYGRQRNYLMANGIFALIATAMRDHLEHSAVQVAGFSAYRNFLHNDFSHCDSDPREILQTVIEICIDTSSRHYIYEHHEKGQGYLVDSLIMNLLQHLTLYSHHKLSTKNERLKQLLEMVYNRYSEIPLDPSESAITTTLLAIDVMKRVMEEEEQDGFCH